MIFRFKLIVSEKEPKVLGMFGDCIKLRVNNEDLNEIIRFLSQELGCNESLVKVMNYNQKKKMLSVDLPDKSYEILMSWIDSK